jgi:hypothetical protein
MRQSGKTTLLRQLAGEYLTLDSPEVAAAFNKGEWNSLDTPHLPLVIDEAQLCPSLFPQLKIRADESQKPGRFLLTGSVRFLSRNQIRESLTGRTSLLELLPMTLAEIHQRPLHNILLAAMTRKSSELLKVLAKRHWCTPKIADVFVETGECLEFVSRGMIRFVDVRGPLILTPFSRETFNSSGLPIFPLHPCATSTLKLHVHKEIRQTMRQWLEELEHPLLHLSI